MIIEVALVLASILQLVACTCFVTFMLTPRFPLRINMALTMVGYVVVLILGRWLEPLLIPKMVAMNVAFLLVALLLFRDSIWHKIFASMYAVLSASAVDLCAMTICIQVFHMTEYEILTNESIRLVVTYIDYVLVLLLWLIPVTVKMHRKRRFSKATLRNFALYPMSHLMALLGFYVILAQWPSRPMALYFAASALVCIFVNVLLLKTMWDTERKAELERKLQVMEYEKGLQIKEYEALQEKETAVAKLAHDYKNQLAVGLTLLQQEEYDRLAQLMISLSDSLTVKGEVHFCENRVVNAVMANKQAVCDREGIRLDAELRVPEKTALLEGELCSIFVNLMDNAIKAVKDLGAADRHISIKADVDEQFLIVKTENPYEPSTYQKGKGVGQVILRDIADKYHGDFVVMPQDGSFLCLLSVEYV